MFQAKHLTWLAEWVADQPPAVQQSLASALEKFPSFNRQRFERHSNAHREWEKLRLENQRATVSDAQRCIEMARKAFGGTVPPLWAIKRGSQK